MPFQTSCYKRSRSDSARLDLPLVYLLILSFLLNQIAAWSRHSCNLFLRPPRIRQRRQETSCWVSGFTHGGNDQASDSFYIRSTQYSDLGAVSEIILSSFYTDPSSPWKQMYRLGELNRLQQNFPYEDELHSMFVAVCSIKEQVIGFVDVDARPSTRKIDPPRPYLSDLAVHPKHRRKGIARTLVQACEERTRQMGKEHLFIRVEIDNAPAVRMYKAMDYESHPHEVFGVSDNTVLLCKMLVEPSNQGNATGDVIDYVV